MPGLPGVQTTYLLLPFLFALPWFYLSVFCSAWPAWSPNNLFAIAFSLCFALVLSLSLLQCPACPGVQTTYLLLPFLFALPWFYLSAFCSARPALESKQPICYCLFSLLCLGFISQSSAVPGLPGVQTTSCDIMSFLFLLY